MARSDIVWYNSQTGETQLWFMDDNWVASRATVVDEHGNFIPIGPPFSIVGAGDMNGDGKADIVWYNSQTGETQIWFMNESRIAKRATVIDERGKFIPIGPPFSIVGVGDMDGDGKADIVWYNSQTGETQIWFMNESRIARRATVVDEHGNFIPIGPPFSIVGVGDMNGDGKADIVWYNSQTGETQLWLMNENRIARRATVVDEHGAFIPIGPPFSIAGVGDMNGDGKADIVWYNSQTGETQIWFMNESRIAKRATVIDERGKFIPIGPPFSIVGIGDFNPPPPPPPPRPRSGPFEFNAPIVSGGAAALGGWMKVTINPDGSVRWHGHAHDSGADGYDFGVSAVVRTSSGRAVAVAHSGHVGGTFTSGSRDDDWDVTQAPNPVIAANVGDFASARIDTNLEYSSDIGSALEAAVGWLVKFGVGTVLTPVATVVFVGLEVGSLVSTGSLVPGARLASGVLWMAGPANTLFAIIAQGIAELGSRTRGLTQEEYDWANNEVFLGALPPRDRLVLTDTIGGGNRAFTFPRFDGKITLNMGSAAFADPRNYPGRARGQTFIHELVHACQIHHGNMDLGLLADAFASKVCEATGGNPYKYGPAGPDYSTFNLEQQAQIVSDWFAGAQPSGSNQTGVPKDTNSPYFRYVHNNVRIGRF
jgi:predicted ABC-type ATPase